ncbi:MAG: dephospho-CoA kinase [Defluviitaleaceae bacterium]|nr:dephospho-CoA kinase [Defluviitaleaceae bacterium]
MNRNKTIVGLTGGSGAGKGEVARIFKARGAEIIDADKLSHKVMLRSETAAFERILETFGEGILGANGEIDRKKLGAIVFSDKAKLDILAGIVHEYVAERVLKIIENSEKQVVVIDAPVLIEAGMEKICDFVVGVFAPRDLRIARICARDGIAPEAAEMRLDKQMADDELRLYADFEIYNNGSIKDLRHCVDVIAASIFGMSTGDSAWGAG